MTFEECVIECAKNRELVENFDRLTGSTLSQVGHRAPLDQMIDEATGRDAESCRRFIAFVWECVWTRLPAECFRESPIQCDLRADKER